MNFASLKKWSLLSHENLILIQRITTIASHLQYSINISIANTRLEHVWRWKSTERRNRHKNSVLDIQPPTDRSWCFLRAKLDCLISSQNNPHSLDLPLPSSSWSHSLHLISSPTLLATHIALIPHVLTTLTLTLCTMIYYWDFLLNLPLQLPHHLYILNPAHLKLRQDTLPWSDCNLLIQEF